MRTKVEDNYQKAELYGEKIGDKLNDNLEELLGELEGKALNVQYTVQEKFSEGIAHKDRIVAKAADSLIETINKVKNTLHSKE